MNQPDIPDQYLGDGVYASFDGYHIWLDLRAQGPERIALEPTVIKSLIDYYHHILNLTASTIVVEEKNEEIEL